MKRDRLKELWVNRPWVLIPKMVRLMEKYPYCQRTQYFQPWFERIWRSCWEICWRN